MENKIMNFEEYITFIESDESIEERKELSAYFENLRSKKRILSFDEWLNQRIEKYVFLTYDLVDTDIFRNRYAPINNYLGTLGFSRMLHGRNLPGNSFVAFFTPLDNAFLTTLGTTLEAFFRRHLPNFRIYMNITSEYFLHP